MPLDIFAGLINLGVLHLQRNQLAALPAGIFVELSSLKQLNLEHNRLSTLPKGLFTGVSLGSGPIYGPDLYLSILEPPYLGLGSNPGAPFTLTLQLERRDHTNLSAPGPATVGVTLVPDGTSPMSVPLPFDLPLSLWVKAGIYASLTRAAPIQAGRTASDDVTVYQRHPNLNVPIVDPVTVGLYVDSWIDRSSALGFRSSGISVAQGKPIVLFGGDFGLFDDDFSSNMALSEASGRRDGSNAGAGKETGEPDHAGNSGGASVWWPWTAPATGSATFDTRGSDFDTLLAVYTGDGLNRLAEVASNDDASDEERQSSVRFRVEQGQTYHVAVDGYDGATGAIVLNWQTAPLSETFIASVEVSIPGPNGLTAVGRDITWVAPAPDVDGLAMGWNLNTNSNGDLHGLQIHVDDAEITVEQWLNGIRQAGASYRDGKPSGVFASYANGELESTSYLIGENNWTFVTFRNGKLHGPFGPYVNGKPKGDFGTFSDGELEGILHTIGEEGWSFEVYRAGTRHGPYGNYNSDGQKDGLFGIYTDGNKDPGEVYWENGEQEPGTENRPPLPIPDNVPEEITFEDFTDSLDLASNLFFWDPDGDSLDLTYFVSSEPPGMFDTSYDGSLIAATLSLAPFTTPGTTGHATVTACDPGGLCAQVDFKALVQPEFTPMDPGDFSVEAPYCEDPSVEDQNPILEVEICARDLMYEDGDELTLKLIAQEGQLPEYDVALGDFHSLDLDFDPLRKSWSCKTVEVQGDSVDLQYRLEPDSKEIHWWDWDWITEPLCQAGWSPDCFVGPELSGHPGNEVNRGELIVRSRIDSGETRAWELDGRGTAQGTIRIRAVGLEPEGSRCAEDTGTDEQAELEAAEQAAGELGGTSTTDPSVGTSQ